jgi:hypothetical protein
MRATEAANDDERVLAMSRNRSPGAIERGSL